MNVTEMQRLAFLFLKRADEVGRNHILGIANILPLESELQISTIARYEVLRYLKDKGLINIMDDGCEFIVVTAYGKDQLVEALREPKKSSDSFPAVYNILHIGSVHESQIQQGTEQSSQTGMFQLTTTDTAELMIILQRLKDDLPNIQGLSAEDRQEATQYAEAVEKNLSLAKPNGKFIKPALQSLYNALENAAGDVIGDIVLKMLKGWMSDHDI